MQIALGDNLHEMSNPNLWEKQEKYFNMSYAANFTQSANQDGKGVCDGNKDWF